MKINLFSSLVLLLFMAICSCTIPHTDKKAMTNEQQIHDELLKITALLRDSSFALEMAENQETSYYTSNNTPAPPFLPEHSDTSNTIKSEREQKIATSIAPFYALECGIGALMERKQGTPVEWLNRLLDKKLDSGEILLLNRFANATWKAGQPFRGLERVTRDVFVSSVFLSEEEIKKDYDQLYAAASKLLPVMSGVKDSSKETQLQQLSLLLKNKQFAQQMAEHIEAAYYTAQHQNVPVFLKPGQESATKLTRLKDEKIAINIAGFYALECGISYVATAEDRLPSTVLNAIITDSIDAKHKILFERFANATWKAGQPFRGLNRIERETFTCFDLLPDVEVEKDWVQIQSAAKKLIKHLPE